MHRAVAARVSLRETPLATDPDVTARYLEDAAHFPGGHAAAVARPATIEETAWVVRQASSVLAVGAQSSLTGGATPAGGVVLSTERLTSLEPRVDTVIAGAGVPLTTLQEALAPRGRWFPPVPTYLGATVGGVIATNAAGAATFKYGPVRPWVRGLTVVLASGDVLRLARGEVVASADGEFVIDTSEGLRRVPVPPLRMPDVPKCSAGYYAAPGMDLVDLFIGSEGTLGVIVAAELAVERRPRGVCWLVVPMPSDAAAIDVTRDLREARDLGVSAIEHLDARSMQILREDGVDSRLGVVLPHEAMVLLLVQIEVEWRDPAEPAATPTLDRLMRLLTRHGADDAAEIVLPANARRAAALVELREAVPAGVNRRVGLAHAVDPRIHKTAADLIVPFARFGELMARIRARASDEGLDLAVWGHISDGNVHPNVIPRRYEDVEKGRRLILDGAQQAVAMGGSPLAEHGVGRHPVKKRLLEMLHGCEGVDAMRRVKLSLDPGWKLADGVLFERSVGSHAG